MTATGGIPRRVRPACVVVSMVALLCASAARGEDWPTYGHDNRRSCATGEDIRLPLKEAWKRTSPSRPQPAWEAPARWDAYKGIRNMPSMRDFDPAFFATGVGGRVAFGSSADDSVYCLDAASGRELWSFTTGGPVRMPPTWSEGKVYFGSDDGNVYCLDGGSGKQVWKYKPSDDDRTLLSNGRVISLWPCRTGVLVQNGKAYFAAALLPWHPSYLCAVDARTGQDKGPGLYKHVLQDLTPQGAMLASQNRLYVMLGQFTPMVFSIADGQLQGPTQKSKRYGGVYATLTPDGKFAYGFGPTSDEMFVHDANTRALVGMLRHTTRLVAGSGAQVTYQRGQLVMEPLTPQGQSAPQGAGQAGWRVQAPACHALVLAGNVVLAGHDDKVVAYDRKNGSQVWSAPVSGRAHGVAAANGRVLVSTDDGTIHCFASR